MNVLLDVVAPVFVLVGLGWGFAVSGILSRETGDGLVAFVFTVAVPLLLARTIVLGPPLDGSVLMLWLAYFGTVLVVWTAADLGVIHLFGRGRRAGVIAGVGAGFSNLVLMGIPLTQLAFGQKGLDILFLVIAVHLPIMVGTATFLMEFALRADGVERGPVNVAGTAKALARNLLSNPLVLGILFGLLWRLSGLPFGGVPARVTDLLGGAAGPVALFALGMGLNKYGIRGNLAPALYLTALSLAAMPAIAFLLATWLGLDDLTRKVVVLGAAMPTGVNAYLFASYFRIAEGMATNTIVLATTGALVTVPLWLALVS